MKSTTIVAAVALACATVFAQGQERERLEEIFLEGMPGLRKIYDKSPGKGMMCFTLAASRAELVPLMPPGEVLLDESSVAQ